MGLNCRLGGELFKGERTKVSLALQYEQRRNSEGQYKWALGAFTDINPNKSEIAKKIFNERRKWESPDLIQTNFGRAQEIQ